MSITSSTPISQRKISAPDAPEVQKAEPAKKPEAPPSLKAQPAADTQVTAKAKDAPSATPSAAAVGALQTATIDRPVQKVAVANPLTAPAPIPNPFASKKESSPPLVLKTDAPPPTGTMQAFSNSPDSATSTTKSKTTDGTEKSGDKGDKPKVPQGVPVPILNLPNVPVFGGKIPDVLAPGASRENKSPEELLGDAAAKLPSSKVSTELGTATNDRPGGDQGFRPSLSAAEQAALTQAGSQLGGNPVTNMTVEVSSGVVPGSAVPGGGVASSFENAVVGGLSVYSADKAAAALIGFAEGQAAKYAAAKGAETGMMALYGELGATDAVAGAGAAGIGSAAAAVAAAGAAGVIFGTVVNLAFNKVSGTTLGDIVADHTGLDEGAHEKEQTAKAAEVAAAKKAAEEAAAAKKAADEAAAAEKAKAAGGGTKMPDPEGEKPTGFRQSSPALQRQLDALAAGRRNQDVTPTPDGGSTVRSGAVVPSGTQQEQNLLGQPVRAEDRQGGSIHSGSGATNSHGSGVTDLQRDAVQSTGNPHTEDPANAIAGPHAGPGLPTQNDSSTSTGTPHVDLPENRGQNQTVAPVAGPIFKHGA